MMEPTTTTTNNTMVPHLSDLSKPTCLSLLASCYNWILGQLHQRQNVGWASYVRLKKSLRFFLQKAKVLMPTSAIGKGKRSVKRRCCGKFCVQYIFVEVILLVKRSLSFICDFCVQYIFLLVDEVPAKKLLRVPSPFTKVEWQRFLWPVFDVEEIAVKFHPKAKTKQGTQMSSDH